MKVEEKVLKLKEIFESKNMTLSLAESCTGGLLSAEIVRYPGVSSFYQGSVVSYSSKVKENILDVPPHLIKTLGEVSEPVALAMARGVKSQLESDWSVSITGVAGPGGGSEEKPVGTVCFGIVGPGFEQTVSQNFKIKNRTEIQQKSIAFALDLIFDSLTT